MKESDEFYDLVDKYTSNIIKNFNDEKGSEHSPRKKDNWGKFKSWAVKGDLFFDEIRHTKSFDEAVETLHNLWAQEKEDCKVNWKMTLKLLCAIEVLYLNVKLGREMEKQLKEK